MIALEQFSLHTTKHQNHTKTMKVETYEVENSAAPEVATMAQDAEAQELIERLGLNGQRKLLNPETATRNPYRAMTKHEEGIYNALLTCRTSLEEYADDCIPLRVLQVAAHAKECGLFDKIEVWHTSPAIQIDDPVLVGRVKIGDYSYRFHMLARWGRELQTLEQLEAIAVTFLRQSRLDALRKITAEVETWIKTVEKATTINGMGGEPRFYNL